MKKTALALKRPMNMGGKRIEPGVPVVVMETDLPWDSLLAALHCGYLVEYSVEQSPVVEQPPAPSEPPEPPAKDEPANESPAVEVASSGPQADETPLAETGLTDSLVACLEREGIGTVEQLEEFARSSGSLSELESIGPRQAKRIEVWLKERQAN